MSTFKIAATQIAETIPTFVNAKRTPLFVSRPGMGKTAMVRVGSADWGKELSAKFGRPITPAVRELHLASMSEVDVRGYLIPNGDQATFTKPEFWADVEANEFGVLFLDEFPQASHEVQKAVAPLILERRIGEFHLPDGWAVMCAGNGTEDGAGANSLLSHVLNRVVLVEVDAPDVDEWVAWAIGAGLPSELIAFAKLRPGVVFESDVPDATDTPYCTPRSLHALGDIANAYPGGLVAMVGSPIGMAMMAGAIGDGATAECAGLIRQTVTLPTFEDAMKNPETCRVPEGLSESYAMAMLVACRATAKDHREQAATYIVRFPVNVALTGIVSLIRRDSGFLHSTTFMKWVTSNRELVRKFQKYINV